MDDVEYKIYKGKIKKHYFTVKDYQSPTAIDLLVSMFKDVPANYLERKIPLEKICADYINQKESFIENILTEKISYILGEDLSKIPKEQRIKFVEKSGIRIHRILNQSLQMADHLKETIEIHRHFKHKKPEKHSMEINFHFS